MKNEHGTGLDSFRNPNAAYRERVLGACSYVLSRTRLPLWYLETLVLSARFFQRVTADGFGTGRRKTRFRDREALWSDGVIPALRRAGSPIRGLEFGVASGRATAWWHANLPEIAGWDGFDTFEGLPEPWTRGGVTVMEQGVFAPEPGQSEFPVISARCPIIWHKGLIGDTITGLDRDPAEVLLILVDVDLLAPTREILDWALRAGRPGDCIYFDEAFDPFNEGLAITEAMERGLTFSVVGYTGSALAIVLE